ncbi:hypothetical protein PTKIN_Ptkin08bG0010100 [Pterospermum kingtungense]
MLSDDRNGASQVKTTKRSVTSCASKSKSAMSSHHIKLEAQGYPVPRGKFNRGRRQKKASCSNFTSDYPNFTVHNLPNAFIRRYIVPETRLVTLQVAERSWLVQLNSYRFKSCLSRGWHEFAEENSIGVDDMCVFKLVNRGDAVLRVSIFKHAG